MRLSELSTDQAQDALCEITPHIQNIVSDETLVDAIGKSIEIPDGTNTYGTFLIMMDSIAQVLPIIMKTHRADIYGILAPINCKSVEEIANQKFIVTLNEIKEALQDKELIDFFKSFMRRAKTVQFALSVPSRASE